MLCLGMDMLLIVVRVCNRTCHVLNRINPGVVYTITTGGVTMARRTLGMTAAGSIAILTSPWVLSETLY